MTRKRLILIITVPILTFIIIYLSYYFLNKQDNDLIKQGNEIIQKVEIYKQKYHKLPNDLSDLGINNSSDDYRLYYSKWNDTTYVIWFGIGVGESKAYHSDRRIWEDED